DEIIPAHVPGERPRPLHLAAEQLPDIRDHGVRHGEAETLPERLEAVQVEITDGERLPPVAATIELAPYRFAAGQPARRIAIETSLRKLQHRAGPGDELARVERLRQIVVGARVEA